MWRETSDLLEIWQAHDKNEWTDEAFEAIRQILLTRMESLPPYQDTIEAEKHLDLAGIYVQSKDFDKALEECNLAIQSAPSYGPAYYYRGMVLDEMGLLSEAIASYEEARRLSPELDEAKFNLRHALDEHAQKTTSKEERIMAGLGHGSILLSYIGILVPVIIWITQKEKSRYVAFQSLQAIAFQGVTVLAQFVWGGCLFLFFIINAVNRLSADTFVTDAQKFFLPFYAIFIMQFVFVIYGLIGAVSTLRGNAFRYVWIGNLVQRFIKQE